MLLRSWTPGLRVAAPASLSEGTAATGCQAVDITQVGVRGIERGTHDNRHPTWGKWRAKYKVKQPYTRAMVALKLSFGGLF